jgi:hypothetical integral membrane protein (TIGR02206 family)
MIELHPIEIFGPDNITSLILLMVLVFAIPIRLKRIQQHKIILVGRMIAVFILVNELVRIIIAVYIYDNPLSTSLPFQLCGFAVLLTAWMLWQQSYRSYEVAYFWGMGGTIPALITPDITVGFPRPTFIHFFAGHGLIMLGVLYATFVYRFRPEFSSVGKAILAGLILIVLVAAINLLLNANYMYLCAKPGQTTLMDYFGPWPWYILWLILIGTIVFYFCYLPFSFLDRQSNQAGN